MESGKIIRSGHFIFDKYIWVQRKGTEKYKKFMKISDFVDQVSKRYSKQTKTPEIEAKKIINRAIFTNPDAILEILQSADKKIEGWKIPSRIKWEKKKLKKVI